MHKMYSEEQLARVVKALDDGKWHYGVNVASRAGITEVYLRSMNNMTGLFVTGNLGYKLAARATPDEYKQTVQHLESRISGLQHHLDVLNAHWKELV